MSYAWIASANFTEANLKETNISWSYATGANFRNANLKNAIGWFVLDRCAAYENTIMPGGDIIKDFYLGEG